MRACTSAPDRARSARRKTTLLVGTTVAVALLAVGCNKPATKARADIAATNSYLGCAVKDLLGPRTAVLHLAEPGMCPGHFDIRPSQINKLRNCRLLLRFDFQKSIDSRLANLREKDLSIEEVPVPSGLCEPSSYLAVCGQVAEALIGAGLTDRKTVKARMEEIAERLAGTTSHCRREVLAAGLSGTPVVTSVHQAAFCRWLKLEVVSSFRAADVESPKQLDQTVRAGKNAGAKLIIANLSEGRRAADAIAEYLGGKVVVFGNFPDAPHGQSSFDDLLTANVARLVEAAGN